MTKDEWIQEAKALLFDAIYCCDSPSLRDEMEALIQKGGGYKYDEESSTTPLRWAESE